MFGHTRKMLVIALAFFAQSSWALKAQSTCVVQTKDAYQSLRPTAQTLSLKFAIMESIEGKLMVVPIENAHETAIYWGFVGSLAASKDFLPAGVKKITPDSLREVYANALLGRAERDLKQAALRVDVVLGPQKNQAVISDHFGAPGSAKILYNGENYAGIFQVARAKVPALKQDMTWEQTFIQIICE